MKLKSIFLKKIDRDIKGVIKVGQSDEENIKQELEEYVVTRELKNHMDNFFEAYKNGITGVTDKNAVWISGFFGSGKSHFLKIISYLLENRKIGRKKAISYFKDKGLKETTLHNMEEAKKASTDVILFNIDSKAESNLSYDKDTIVNVFNRSFNEMQGFSGSMPWIADLERQMVKDGVYENFRTAFEDISGKSWIDGRDDFYYEEDSIIKALAKTTKMSEDTARNWYEKCEHNYSLSVDKFAVRVNEYNESKGKNHHVVFLVDEIGQYIGDNGQLMLNLQTIVEDLGTKCFGKCWVIVTSQDGLDEFTKENSKDFSKIQGRFNTRLSLSSANVDEVIKKRILRKNKKAENHLREIYKEKESVIKNILTFSSDSEMKLYESSEDFVESYPFIPYQFSLLKDTFKGIREHGASGRSLSQGERSLLEAYQQVAVEYMNKDTNTLIPFSAFYKTIETFLDSSITEVIIGAENNKSLNSYDLKVLKVLFLVKYVKGFEANLDNISTLLVDSLNGSKKEIKENVQEALNKLVKENLVQRNGDEYSFLTNDEQSVNKEIKNISVNTDQISEKVGEIIFEDIYGESRFNYSPVYKFNFNKAVDNRKIGIKKSEIGMVIITSNFDLNGDRTSELKRLSTIENSVIVDISNNHGYLEEIENLLKIDGYLRTKGSTNSTEAIKEIKEKKNEEREGSLARAKILIDDALRSADIYAAGGFLEINEKNGVERVNESLRTLINSEYFKLNYIKAFKNNTEDLYNIVNSGKNDPSFLEESNGLAIDEVRSHIEGSNRRNLQITVWSVISKFSKLPYGWKKIDIQGIIIELFITKQIKAVLDGKSLSFNNVNIVEYVTNREYMDKVTLKRKEKVNSKYIEAVEDLTKHLFNSSVLPKDEDEMMETFKRLCKGELIEINEMLAKYNDDRPYPGEEVLKSGKKLFEQIEEVDDTLRCFKEIYAFEDEFLDYVDDIDNIKSFFFKKNNGKVNVFEKGEQRIIFDRALETLREHEDNKDFMDEVEIKDVIGKIALIVGKAKPFNDIQAIPELINEYSSKVISVVDAERVPMKDYIEKSKMEVLEELESYEFKMEFEEQIISEFDYLNEKNASACSLLKLASMDKLVDRAKLKWIKIIRSEGKSEDEVKAKYKADCKSQGKAESKAEELTRALSLSELVNENKVIRCEADIDAVVESLKAQLKEQLKMGITIDLV